jgi:hypothetical protein
MKNERGSAVGMILFVVVVLGIVAYLINRQTGGSAGPAGDTSRYRSILAFNNLVHLGLGNGDPQEILNSIQESIAPDGCIELKKYDENTDAHVTTNSSPAGCLTTPNLTGMDPSKMYAVLSFSGEPASTIEATLEPPSVQGIYGPPPGGFGKNIVPPELIEPD